jgi:hypothetical protein
MSKILKTLLIPSLIILFVLSVWQYPFFIDKMIQYYSHLNIKSSEDKGKIDPKSNKKTEISTPKLDRDILAERGTFGDMFGLLNAIFSGLALLGVVYSIIEDKDRAKKERLQVQKDKIAFLSGILIKANTISNLIVTYYKSILEQEYDNFTDFDNLILYTDTLKFQVNQLNKLITGLNEEEYFLAYIENISDRSNSYFNRTTYTFQLFETLNELPQLMLILDESVNENNKKIKKIRNEILGFIYDLFVGKYGRVDEIFRSTHQNFLSTDKTCADIEELCKDLTKLCDIEENEIVYRSSFSTYFIQNKDSIKTKLNNIMNHLNNCKEDVAYNIHIINQSIIATEKEIEIISNYLMR